VNGHAREYKVFEPCCGSFFLGFIIINVLAQSSNVTFLQS
jgi:hypothetical protein